MGILSNIVNEKKTKTRLDPKCWDGYKKQGTKMKDGVRVNNCVKEDGSPWTTTGKHPEQMDADELRDELAVFDELRDRGEHLSPQELAREDTLWDYLEQIDGPQVQYEEEVATEGCGCGCGDDCNCGPECENCDCGSTVKTEDLETEIQRLKDLVKYR